MTPQKLMDAMNYLPEELIEKTDALRQKKRNHWKSWAALAACLCMAVGAVFMVPGAKSADNASGAGEYEYMDEDADTIGSAQLESGSTGGIIVYVHEVYEDYIVVEYSEWSATCDCVKIRLVKVQLEGLENIPKLSVGQKIRIYTDEELGVGTITPDKIVIEED